VYSFNLKKAKNKTTLKKQNQPQNQNKKQCWTS